MGLIVNVYRTVGYNCTNGPSYDHDRLTIINVPGPFEPSEKAPAAILELSDAGVLRIIPDVLGAQHFMMGGNYAATSDSRFGMVCEELLGSYFYGAVAIHDRTE